MTRPETNSVPQAGTAWRDGIQIVHDAAGGLLDINIIDAADGREMLAAAALGNFEAAMLMRAVYQAASRINHAPRRSPVLCICCPRSIKRLTPRLVFGVAFPAIAKPSNAIGFAFCERCSEDRNTLAIKAAEGLRQIWPDLRPVVVTHPKGGRA